MTPTSGALPFLPPPRCAHPSFFFPFFSSCRLEVALLESFQCATIDDPFFV
ncbi:hypothetical protein Syun_026116 [Stephania yunnanensis]|uniref:Uncharacterized protein n=1 Tax=Stephania yunnanensis TaxID=152371 RepID=A0AAP0ETP5_9MAGN